MSPEPPVHPDLASAGIADVSVTAPDLFVRFMRHLPGLAWVKDANGRFVFANDAALKAFGVRDITGLTNADLFAPEFAQQCDASDRQALANEAGAQVVESYPNADGSTRSCLVSKFAILGTDGRPMIGGIAVDVTARRDAEEQLRLSEERLRLTTETGKVGLWDWDIGANRISWTGSLYEIYGVAAEEFDGTFESFAALTHPEDRAHVLAAIDLALAGKRDYEIELRAVRPDGQTIWLFTNATVIRDGDRAVRMLGAALDITARKRTELELLESKERFAKAFNASPLSLTLSSLRTGRLLEVNDTFVRVAGYSRTEAIGRTTMDLGLWKDPRERAAELEEVRRGGRIRDAHYRFTTRDGRERLGRLSAERIDIGGEPHALTVIEDITEAAATEEALRRSERIYRAIGETIDYGTWVCDPSGRNIYASESFLRLVGQTQEQCSEFGWGEILHPDDREETLAAWQECVRTGTDWDRQHRFLGVDGAWHPVLARGVSVRDEDGNVVAWAGINLDIARLKQVEDELRGADERKNEFLATLAHELRNPLAPIRNGLEILRLTNGRGEAADKAREVMDRQIRQMVRLIDDLLDLSRISSGKIELRRERVDIADALDSALETSLPLIQSGRHTLTLDVVHGMAFVDADPTRLTQIFANLMNNAAKYTAAGGSIWLTLSLEQDWVRISVRDNGVGIPPHLLTRIFDMFTQVESSAGSEQGGLGIGLNIAMRLVEMHGGTIEARSQGAGTGSEFIIRLPVQRAQQARPADPPLGVPVIAPATLRILVADDNLDAATSLALLLEMDGHEVRKAANGNEAVELAMQFHPHVVLLDIGMPLVNGYEACRLIRERSSVRDPLIVAMTGWGQAEDRRKTHEAGFDHHLVKPVDLQVLNKLLNLTG